MEVLNPAKLVNESTRGRLNSKLLHRMVDIKEVPTNVDDKLNAESTPSIFDHRYILAVLVTLAFMIGGIIEQSSSIALMANKNSSVSAKEFAQYVENTSYITRSCNVGLNGTRSVHPVPHIEMRMSLNDETESILREAFMWGCLISPLAASRYAVRVGAENLFGYAILGAGVASALVPASWLGSAHVGLRIVQGMCIGATWPTAHMLAVSWIDYKHISLFVSCYAAVNLGYGVGGAIGIPLVQTFGRDSISFVVCFISFAWYFFWWKFVEVTLLFKTPLENVRQRVPWDHLLSSKPVWICALTVLGSQWADATMMLGVLKYLKLVYGYSTMPNHVLSFLPNIGHFLAAITFGAVVDHLREIKLLTNTNARRVFVYISHFLPSALLFIIGFTACDSTVPAFMYTVALALTGATPAGSYACAIDLAPEHAGTIFGLCTTLGAAGLLAANYVVREGLHGSFAIWWRLVFGIAAFALFATASIFLALGHGRPQHWSSHYYPKRNTELLNNFMKRISMPRIAARGGSVLARGSIAVNTRDSIIVEINTSRRNSASPGGGGASQMTEVKTFSFILTQKI